MADLSFVSVNVCGMSSAYRCKLVVRALSKWDVVFVQESYVCNMSKAMHVQRAWPGQCFWSFGGVRNARVGILIKDRCGLRVSDVRRDTDGRVVSVLVESNGARVSFVCAYAPDDLRERKLFFRDLYQYVFPASRIVLAGDFNCVLRDVDTSCKSGANRVGGAELKEFLGDWDLTDLWVVFHGRATIFTWVGRGVGSRLDRIYVSKDLVSSVSSVFVEPMGLSDHDGVKCVFKGLGEGLPGGRWKFNGALLKEKRFVEGFRAWVVERVRVLGENGNWWADWPVLKEEMREFCVKYGKERARWKRIRRDGLTKGIIGLKRRMARGEKVGEEILKMEGHLKALVAEEFEGVKVRSRAEWIEDGERPSRFFFNFMREREKANRMEVLKDSGGVERTVQEEMLGVVEDFYSLLRPNN